MVNIQKLAMQFERVRGECDEHGPFESTVAKFGDQQQGYACPECLKASIAAKDAERQAQERVQRRARMLEQIRLPLRFSEVDVADYEPVTDAAARIKAACGRYVQNFPELAQRGAGMLMTGNVGTGKTMLACAVARGVVQTHMRRALYTTTYDTVARIRETYSPDTIRTEREVIDELVGFDLLVLDEAGVQLGTDHEHITLFNIINRRYNEMRPTIMISNLSAGELGKAMGERLVDRLRENGADFSFSWDSYRGRAAA